MGTRRPTRTPRSVGTVYAPPDANRATAAISMSPVNARAKAGEGSRTPDLLFTRRLAGIAPGPESSGFPGDSDSSVSASDGCNRPQPSYSDSEKGLLSKHFGLGLRARYTVAVRSHGRERSTPQPPADRTDIMATPTTGEYGPAGRNR
jgi:hypothetical protein